MNFAGMTVSEVASQLGKPERATLYWLKHRHYRLGDDGRLRPSRGAQDVIDEVHARIQAMRPQTNCFRCGARGECAHR